MDAHDPAAITAPGVLDLPRTGVRFTRIIPLALSARVPSVYFLSFSAFPCGRFTCSESRFCIASEDSMKVASRKNITSIIGMISMRPLRYVLGLRSFMGVTLLVQTDVIDQACAEALHFVHRLRLHS